MKSRSVKEDTSDTLIAITKQKNSEVERHISLRNKYKAFESQKPQKAFDHRKARRMPIVESVQNNSVESVYVASTSPGSRDWNS